MEGCSCLAPCAAKGRIHGRLDFRPMCRASRVPALSCPFGGCDNGSRNWTSRTWLEGKEIRTWIRAEAGASRSSARSRTSSSGSTDRHSSGATGVSPRSRGAGRRAFPETGRCERTAPAVLTSCAARGSSTRAGPGAGKFRQRLRHKGGEKWTGFRRRSRPSRWSYPRGRIRPVPFVQKNEDFPATVDRAPLLPAWDRRPDVVGKPACHQRERTASAERSKRRCRRPPHRPLSATPPASTAKDRPRVRGRSGGRRRRHGSVKGGYGGESGHPT
jgi:hypothetical protein